MDPLFVTVRSSSVEGEHEDYTRHQQGERGKVALRRLKVRCEAPGEQQIKSRRGAPASAPRPLGVERATRDNVSPKGKCEYFHRIISHNSLYIQLSVRALTNGKAFLKFYIANYKFASVGKL